MNLLDFGNYYMGLRSRGFLLKKEYVLLLVVFRRSFKFMEDVFFFIFEYKNCFLKGEVVD